MVRILANGDIVQDNDPRVRNTTTQRSNFGQINTSTEENYQRNRQGGAYQDGAQGPTIFDTWNQKLLELGIPRWNIGSHVVEPIMTVMVLIVLLFFGFPGLMFLGLLYFVVKVSQRSTGQQPPARTNRPSRQSGRPGGGGGGGHRLGR